MTYRAFQGANGWYVASEDEQGFHRQPAGGGNMTAAEAEAEAKRLADWGDDDDYEWSWMSRPHSGRDD